MAASNHETLSQQIRFDWWMHNGWITLDRAEVEGLSFSSEPLRIESVSGTHLAGTPMPIEFSLCLNMSDPAHANAAAKLMAWYQAIEKGSATFSTSGTERTALKASVQLKHGLPQGIKMETELEGVVLKGWRVGAFRPGQSWTLTAFLSADRQKTSPKVSMKSAKGGPS